MRPGMQRFGEQRALNLGGEMQLAIQARLLGGFAIQPRAFDGRRGFAGNLFERASRRSRHQLPALAAVEIQHPEGPLFALAGGIFEIPDDAQRRAQDVANTEGDGTQMLHRDVAVHQIGDNSLAAGREDFLRNLLARREGLARQRFLAARPRDLELEIPFRARKHDEPAFGACRFNRRVHDEHQHFVEHARRPEAAQPIEQRRQWPEVDHIRAMAGTRVGLIVREKHHLGAAVVPQPDSVSMLQRPLGHLFAVHEGSTARSAISQHETSVIQADDLGVLARHVGAARA